MDDSALPALNSWDPHGSPLLTEAFWREAKRVADGYPTLASPIQFQGPYEPIASASEAVERLRAEIKTSFMAFRAVLPVHSRPAEQGYAGWTAWEIELPLALFPARDRAFSVVDVAVHFQSANSKGLQIVSAAPDRKDRSLARIDIKSDLNAQLALAASRKAGIPVPVDGSEASIAKVGGALDANFATSFGSGLAYEISRPCSDLAIAGAGMVRWRLDRPEDDRAVRLDAAKLSVHLVVAPDAGPVSAFGAAVAWSKAKWLSADLRSLSGHLRTALGGLFVHRQPTECRAEWTDLLPTAGGPAA